MRKGQIQTFESIFVILIFFVMVGLGLVFYTIHQKISINEKVSQYGTLDAIKVALLAQNAPEFVCTSNRYISHTCFDINKLEAFQQLILTNSDYRNRVYFGLFGFSKINVTRLYPSPTKSWLLYERPPPPTSKTTHSFMIPVGLEDASLKQIHLGVMKVEVYS